MIGNGRAYQEKPAYPLTKRLRRMLLSFFRLWHREGYDVRFVRINDKHYKKIIFRNEAFANRVHHDLKAFGPSPHFPAVVGKRGNVLWVEFVIGSPIRNVDENVLSMLAAFYADIYRREPRLAALHETDIWHEFYQDLDFLHEVKILDEGPYRELIDQRHELFPETIWFGFDYVDPITANLMLREKESAICAIDIKNLYSNAIIGMGIAKARSRWLNESLAGSFFEQIESMGAPSFRSYLPFLEMANRIKRIKRMALRGQLRSLRPADFNRHLASLIRQARNAQKHQPLDGAYYQAGTQLPSSDASSR